MCSRIKYETGTRTYITGRGMDWNDPTAETDLWVFPRGMERDGGIGENPVKWTSKYGSVVASFYNAATADGINEKGLVGNVLYLAEADYGDAAIIFDIRMGPPGEFLAIGPDKQNSTPDRKSTIQS